MEDIEQWRTQTPTGQQPVRSPDNRLLAMMLGVASTQLIGLAAQLNIPDLLHDGAKSIETIAEATGTRKEALLQAMRALTALGIFAEPRSGHFAITSLGELLRTGVPNSLRGYAIMLASGMMLRGWANLSHALRTSQGALDDALGMETYAYLQQNEADAAVFDAAMSSVSGQESSALPRRLRLLAVSHSCRCGRRSRPCPGGPPGRPSRSSWRTCSICPTWQRGRAPCLGSMSRVGAAGSRAGTSVNTCRLVATRTA